jgi:hypothetical protein
VLLAILAKYDVMTTSDVESTEMLVRQISRGGVPLYIQEDRTPLVHQAAFLPSREDTDGLSMIRDRFRARIWSAFRPQRVEVRYILALLRAEDLLLIAQDVGLGGLSFSATPDELDNQFGCPFAHCVANEINRRDYEASKVQKIKIKNWAEGVVAGIDKSTVVGPFPKPRKGQDPYRPDELADG